MQIAARRNSRPYGLKLTLAGGIYIGLTLLLGFAAVNTGNNLLYLMISALLGFMAVSGLLGQQNLQQLAVKLYPVDDLFANCPAGVEIELENRRRWLPAFLISVELENGVTLIPLLAAGGRQRQRLTLVFNQRGYADVPNIWIRSCFPINFFVRSRCLPLHQKLLVFPQPVPARLALAAGTDTPFNRHEIAQPGIDGELRSVDSYREGDPLRSIHWKLSARHDEYKVKRQNRLGAPSLLLNLDDFSGTLDTQLSQCTFLINQLISQQRAVGLCLDKQVLSPAQGNRQRLRLLTELALYGRR